MSGGDLVVGFLIFVSLIVLVLLFDGGFPVHVVSYGNNPYQDEALGQISECIYLLMLRFVDRLLCCPSDKGLPVVGIVVFGCQTLSESGG